MKDLSLHILDIAHNSIRAGASSVKISMNENKERNIFIINIEDNGQGIDPGLLSKVTDPFTTSRKTRSVGMGLPLLGHNAHQAGGDLKISSEPGEGTLVTARFQHDHIDRPPLGDIAGVLLQLIGGFSEIRFIYTHQTEGGTFTLDSSEIYDILKGVSLSNPEIRKSIREMILENLADIGAVH